MFGAIVKGVTAVSNAVRGVTDAIVGRQKAAERHEQRDAGRNEQKVVDSEAAVERARQANEAREDSARRDDAELNSRLRKRQSNASSE